MAITFPRPLSEGEILSYLGSTYPRPQHCWTFKCRQVAVPVWTSADSRGVFCAEHAERNATVRAEKAARYAACGRL